MPSCSALYALWPQIRAEPFVMTAPTISRPRSHASDSGARRNGVNTTFSSTTPSSTAPAIPMMIPCHGGRSKKTAVSARNTPTVEDLAVREVQRALVA